MTKPRVRKKNAVVETNRGTLDQKHTDKIDKIEKMSQSLPAKKQKLSKLQSELKQLSELKPNKRTNMDIRRKTHLVDLINNTKSEIDAIENCTESLNYIVKTLPILVNYYDNKEIIDDGIEELMSGIDTTNGKNNILSYFAKENDKNIAAKSAIMANKTNAKSKTSGSKTSKPLKNSTNIFNITNPTNSPTPPMSRAKLYDNYLCATDVTYRRAQKKNNFCNDPDCNGELFLSQNDACMVCSKCGLTEKILMTTDKPNYKEPTQDSGSYAYKRINHLTEILSQLQAKESTDIPEKVFTSILNELKKRKIDKNELDIFRLRRILKTLNYRKFYEHIPHILQIINGKEPPNFSRKDEMKIKQMFKSIQKPFAIYCPPNRKNFLNYSYVLHKFCELLGLDEYVSYFPLLKHNTKLIQHDKIWQNICKYMRWQFFKSL